MSKENAQAFYEKVKGDQVLQRKIGELTQANPAEMESIIIKVAGESGFQFTVAEMRAVMAEAAPKTGELNDAELESVAGGSKGGWISNSIISFGVACAGSAAIKKAGAGCSLDSY